MLIMRKKRGKSLQTLKKRDRIVLAVTLIAMKREVAARVAQVFRGANVKFENWRQVTVQS